MTEQEKMIALAVDWWLNYMDGTAERISSYQAEEELKTYTRDKFNKIVEEGRFLEELHNIYLFAKVKEDYNKKKDFYITQEQKSRLKIKLTSLIKKELENKNFVYLYSDENGFAGGTLAVAMELSSIKNGMDEDDAIGLFPKGTDMFISPNKVEVRYNEDSPLSTIYEIEEEEKF